MTNTVTKSGTGLKFIPVVKTDFFATVRRRVDAYFTERQLSPHANGAMWQKAVFFLVSYAGLYGLILSNQFGGWATLGLAVLLGLFAAFIGFNVSHDALHDAFSAKSRTNRLLGHSFNLIGASPYVWRIMHNVVHHTYTNIPGHDEDIEVAPGLVRLDTDEPHKPWQRYQHLYAFPLYGLASLSWVFRKDYVKFFKKKIGQHENKHQRQEYINLFAYKAAYYVAFLLVPLLVLNFSWWQILLGFLVMHIVEGLTIGLVFQLAHVVEGTSFPAPTVRGTIEEAWAVHQLQTTANFAPQSRIATFFCGGLNRQIEHHLFPRICHVHYQAISVIVKQTAQEFQLPYLENPTFFSALASHYRLLRKMGQVSTHQATSGVDLHTSGHVSAV